METKKSGNNVLPGNFGVVAELGLHELLVGDGLLNDGRHVGGGLTDSGVTLDFRGSSKTQRLTKETISMSDEQICGIE